MSPPHAGYWTKDIVKHGVRAGGIKQLLNANQSIDLTQNVSFKSQNRERQMLFKYSWDN